MENHVGTLADVENEARSTAADAARATKTSTARQPPPLARRETDFSSTVSTAIGGGGVRRRGRGRGRDAGTRRRWRSIDFMESKERKEGARE